MVEASKGAIKMQTVQEVKRKVREFTGNSSVNYLRFQFEELRAIKGNTREFWRVALYLCEESYIPKRKPKAKKMSETNKRRMISKVDFTERERQTIAYAIERDTFGNVKVDKDLITQAYIIEDQFFFYYYDEKALSVVCQPIDSKQFYRFAKDYEEGSW